MTNAFIGKAEQPTREELRAVLGPAGELWDSMQAALAELDLTDAEWSSYSAKSGWALRMKKGKRNIVYLSPGRGEFTASFALGDRAVEAARHRGFSKSFLALLDTAKRYAEGTGIRIEVRNRKDVELVRRVAALKLEF